MKCPEKSVQRDVLLYKARKILGSKWETGNYTIKIIKILTILLTFEYLCFREDFLVEIDLLDRLVSNIFQYNILFRKWKAV